MSLRLGTRTSALALAQAGQVAGEIERVTGSTVIRVGIQTEGDRLVDTPLTGPLAKGWFTGAIEAALREHRIDVAVHSLKDLPVAETGEFSLIIPERADPRDVWVMRADRSAVTTVGASSPRRLSLLKHYFPSMEGRFLRGNVTTRIQRLRDGQFDAILLAAAGLERLTTGSSWAEPWALPQDLVALPLDPLAWPGAPGQGALALQIRSDDVRTHASLRPLDHANTRAAVGIERGALAALGSGCSLPFGAYVGDTSACISLDEHGVRVAVTTPAALSGADGEALRLLLDTPSRAHPHPLLRDLHVRP